MDRFTISSSSSSFYLFTYPVLLTCDDDNELDWQQFECDQSRGQTHRQESLSLSSDWSVRLSFHFRLIIIRSLLSWIHFDLEKKMRK